MSARYIPHILVTMVFVGFLFLCMESESMNTFLLSKLVGIILISVAYGLSKLLKSHININHHK